MVTTNKNIKEAAIMKKQKRKRKASIKTVDAPSDSDPNPTQQLASTASSKAVKKSKPTEESQYPILNDDQLVQKFRSVPMTNNQKGRIRQLLRDSLKGTSESVLPEVIHNRIQVILKSSDNLSDSDLRKMRILYNMLKTAVQPDNSKKETTENKDEGKKIMKKLKKPKVSKTSEMETKIKEPDIKETEGIKNLDKKEVLTKVKGPKRYVVFVGNLPLDVNKEKIIEHFSELKDSVKDVRIPKQSEGKKSAIAYVELENEITYELALSKHHSMLGNKRINVLYTTQKKGKITKTEAKSKTAKLVAMQKSGKLIGSVPMNKKRSHRRMKMKQAQAKLAAGSA